MTSENPQPHPEAAVEGGTPRPPAAPAPLAPRGPRPSYGGGRPSYGGGGGGGDRGSGGPGGPRRPRRKVCSFCVEKVQKIDYKDVGRIRRYISERGKIDPRRKSGSCAKHQRMLTTALKRARFMALLPYTADHVRGLMSPQARTGYVAEVRQEYVRIAAAHARGQESKQRLSLQDARANSLKLDWSNYAPRSPQFLGTRVLADYSVTELIGFIDWSPFFATWELTGKYPAILDDAKYGPAARSLFADAQAMLERIVAERWLRANAVFGFWPANADGDDILVYGNERRAEPMAVLHTLRQQLGRREGRANLALADFIMPRARARGDYIGAFIVTAGMGEEALADRFKGANDDYSAILLKALADRLAEAFAERLHQRVRTEFWGYACDETLSNAELIAEKYRGIRPAPGYPAQPDHSEKATLFTLLDGERRSGVRLTESFAMWPPASVCGLYFGHPESRYFGIGKIERDQVEDYAARKGWSVDEAEKWLAPVLNYDPLAVARTAAE